MNSFKVKLFGLTVAELLCTEPEVVLRIDNTGGQIELADGPYSTDFASEESWDEEDSSDFGFRRALGGERWQH